MSKLNRFLLAIVVVIGCNTVYAGCLSDYNHALYWCDSHVDGGFTLAGCRADAWVDYYACILNNATV